MTAGWGVLPTPLPCALPRPDQGGCLVGKLIGGRSWPARSRRFGLIAEVSPMPSLRYGVGDERALRGHRHDESPGPEKLGGVPGSAERHVVLLCKPAFCG